MRKHCHRKTRPIHVPIMRSTWMEIATGLHTALGAMHTNPCAEVYDTLAGAFSAVGITIAEEAKYRAEAQSINQGAETLLAIADAVLVGAPLRQAELKSIAQAVKTIDHLLPHLDFASLCAAEAAAVAAVRSQRGQQLRSQRSARA